MATLTLARPKPQKKVVPPTLSAASRNASPTPMLTSAATANAVVDDADGCHAALSAASAVSAVSHMGLVSYPAVPVPELDGCAAAASSTAAVDAADTTAVAQEATTTVGSTSSRVDDLNPAVACGHEASAVTGSSATVTHSASSGLVDAYAEIEGTGLPSAVAVAHKDVLPGQQFVLPPPVPCAPTPELSFREAEAGTRHIAVTPLYPLRMPSAGTKGVSISIARPEVSRTHSSQSMEGKSGLQVEKPAATQNQAPSSALMRAMSANAKVLHGVVQSESEQLATETAQALSLPPIAAQESKCKPATTIASQCQPAITHTHSTKSLVQNKTVEAFDIETMVDQLQSAYTSALKVGVKTQNLALPINTPVRIAIMDEWLMQAPRALAMTGAQYVWSFDSCRAMQYNVWSAGYRLQADELKREAAASGIRTHMFFSPAGKSLRDRLMRVLATNGFRVNFGVYETDVATDVLKSHVLFENDDVWTYPADCAVPSQAAHWFVELQYEREWHLRALHAHLPRDQCTSSPCVIA